MPYAAQLILGWGIFAGLLAAGILYGRWSRRRQDRRAEAYTAAMVARDKEREQLQLQSLRGIPDVAPFAAYATEWEWEQDLRRMTLMGYRVLELDRIPYADGSDNEVQVQWQADPRALQRAQRELRRVVQ